MRTLDTKARKFSLADLFAGPGGLSLGFTLSGFFQPVVAVECSPIVAETYERNLGIEVIQNDVAKIEPTELLEAAKEQGFKSIDIVIGGPPCRAFTTANRGRTKWEVVREKIIIEKSLAEHPDWLAFWRMIDSLKPQGFVAENVMGFKTSSDVLTNFIQKSESSGYTTDFRVLNAQHFGVPQRRKRIFIVGLKGFNGDKNTLFPNISRENDTKTVTVEQAINDLPDLRNDASGFKISKYRRGRPTSYQSLVRNKSKILFDHVTHSVHPTMAERFQYIPQGYNLRKAWVEGIIPESSMQSRYRRGRVLKGFSEKTLKCMHSNIYRRLKWNDVSCTITNARKTVLIHPLQDRLLSVREAARLQSFPDSFRFSGSLDKQYQQIADAVPPLLAKAVALNIGELLTSTYPYIIASPLTQGEKHQNLLIM